ncbi:MAG: hypothetical protein LBB52_06370, partial [Desulfovibrio sp.]|nr:hypothetical protein [Desulfovibrio sp.]
MQSTVHLFNVALGRLGGEQLPRNISPQEDNALGKLCENLLPHVLDLTFAAHHWSFALRRVALASVPDADAANYGYRPAFQMPADCVKPVRLEGSPAYVIEGTALRTNQEKPVFTYVRRVTDPKLWPPSFADVLAWGLAGELASARVNDGQKQNWCYQNYKIALADA